MNSILFYIQDVSSTSILSAKLQKIFLVSIMFFHKNDEKA